ncbi:MAG TPA: hypothetical protein VF516_35015 [Kofleriaceae bacterium]
MTGQVRRGRGLLLPPRLVVDRYVNQQESLRAIARDYQVAPTTVRRLLLDEGVTLRDHDPRTGGHLDNRGRPPTPLPAAEMAERYAAGDGLRDLSRRYQIAPSTAGRAVVRGGGTLRAPGRPREGRGGHA